MEVVLALLLVSGAASHKHDQRTNSLSSSRFAYTTITPSGSHTPVTVTAQYQTIPSFDPHASTYSQYLWVSTFITDVEDKRCTVTKTEEPVTIRHTKTTITHTQTIPQRLYAIPTGGYHNGTLNWTYKMEKWKELYEFIGEAEYKDLGPYALDGYPGSGLCGYKCYGEDEIKYQPVHVKEYKHGKWSYYNATYTYGPPTPKTTTYETTGTFMIPTYDITVHDTFTVPIAAIYTASAGIMVMYGGVITSVAKPCTVTAQYGAFIIDGKETKTVIKTSTVYARKPGYYTIATPTVTKYTQQTECTYPTTKVYQPGVYHHSEETITITKPHQEYTCSYHQTSLYPTPKPTSHQSPTRPGYPAQATPTNAGYGQPWQTSSLKHATSYSSQPSYQSSGYATHRSSASSVDVYSSTQPGYPTDRTTTNTYHDHIPHTTSSKHESSNPTQVSSLTSTYATRNPSPSSKNGYTTPSPTQSDGPDPSSDCDEVDESYGTAEAGYVKRGGIIERHHGKRVVKPSKGKRVILV